MVVVAEPFTVSPPPIVPLPMVDDAVDSNPERMPREVSDEARTFEARVAPVRLAAGTVPVNAPDMVCAESVPMVAVFALSAVVDARVEMYKYVLDACVAEMLPRVARFESNAVVDACPEM